MAVVVAVDNVLLLVRVELVAVETVVLRLQEVLEQMIWVVAVVVEAVHLQVKMAVQVVLV
jgi:hypothetical protein